MESKKFSWHSRMKSFVFAFRGLAHFFRHEHNAWIHGVAAVIVLTFSIIMKVRAMEMIVILIAIAIVWIAEMFNTAIEKTMDHLSPAIHPDVKVIKDIAAGAVLVAAFLAILIGLIIFIPKFL